MAVMVSLFAVRPRRRRSADTMRKTKQPRAGRARRHQPSRERGRRAAPQPRHEAPADGLADVYALVAHDRLVEARQALEQHAACGGGTQTIASPLVPSTLSRYPHYPDRTPSRRLLGCDNARFPLRSQ
jgi:hypothetical protein